MSEVDKIDKMMPLWFPRLGKGQGVFGRRKDKLILEILNLHGMDLLESECGFRFEKHSQPELFTTNLNILLKIKKKLLQRRAIELKILSKTKKIEIKYIKLNGDNCIVVGKLMTDDIKRK